MIHFNPRIHAKVKPKLTWVPKIASSAPSLRLSQMYMHEPRERGISPGFVAIIVGGISVVVAGLMV